MNCCPLLLYITLTVRFHYLIFMAQLPELPDLNISTPSGLLAEAVKLCSNIQIRKTIMQYPLGLSRLLLNLNSSFIVEVTFTAAYTTHNYHSLHCHR